MIAFILRLFFRPRPSVADEQRRRKLETMARWQDEQGAFGVPR